MNKNVDTLTSTMTLRDALMVLRDRRHGSYPLLDDTGAVLGSLNREDIYDLFKRTCSLDTSLEELAPRDLPSLSTEATVDDALDVLQSSGRNKALVINQQGAPTGLVTWLDLIQ